MKTYFMMMLYNENTNMIFQDIIQVSCEIAGIIGQSSTEGSLLPSIGLSGRWTHRE